MSKLKKILIISSVVLCAGILAVLFSRPSRKAADIVIATFFTEAVTLMNRQEDLSLPFNNTLPIIYDNDCVHDAYTDDYLMALASAGNIQLIGMMTSCSIKPFNKYVGEYEYEKDVANRAQGVRHARDSGFINIPDPVRGTKGHLEKPPSGRIEDTKPLDSEGSRLIVREAGKASPDKPLVLIMGGPLTVAADAYLLDRSIADKVIVAWLGGRKDDMADYNGWADPWAAFIVLDKLKLVQFPAWEIGMLAGPSVPKKRLAELPDTALRKWMIEKQHENGLPEERDADAPPAIVLMRWDYVPPVRIMRVKELEFKAFKPRKVVFSHWITEYEREQPAFKEDPHGKTMVVTYADKTVATEEWWRALKNPAAYSATANQK